MSTAPRGEQTYTHKCQLFIISFYSQLPTNLIRIFWAPIFHLLIHQKWREKQTSEILRTRGFRVSCLKLLFYLIVHWRQIIFSLLQDTCQNIMVHHSHNVTPTTAFLTYPMIAIQSTPFFLKTTGTYWNIDHKNKGH